MYVCERCGEQVRPASDDGITYAVKLERVDSMGLTTEYLESLGTFFHEACFPFGSTSYRRKPMPDGIDDGDE